MQWALGLSWVNGRTDGFLSFLTNVKMTSRMADVRTLQRAWLLGDAEREERKAFIVSYVASIM